jgi:hypothetical protein
MNTNEIAQVILRDLAGRLFPIFLTTFSHRGMSEADVFGINKTGYICEFEIKRSRSDYLADFKNKEHKHKKLSTRESIHIIPTYKFGKKTIETSDIILIPNRFSYACESGLISKDEVPEYSGLYYVDKYGIKAIKYPPLLHKTKATSDIYEHVAHTLSYRMVFGCSQLSFIRNKESLLFEKATNITE